MNELGLLKALAYSGGGWVIYLLIGCSVLTVAVAVEKLLVLARERRFFAALKAQLSAPLAAGDLEAAARAAGEASGSAARILQAGLVRPAAGPAAAEERAAAARADEKRFLERRLLVLGTLGNNAPFIGLFGTVLGVIKAFHDLAAAASAGPEVVMQGLSEALIATAVGLLVAIPAVVAFNYFHKGFNDLLGETESLLRLALARMKEEPGAGRRPPSVTH